MYQADSLVSYSFFSHSERTKILALLEKAYLTLINESQRTRYDNELNPKENMQSQQVSAKKPPVNIFDINRQTSGTVVRKSHNAELKKKISENRHVGEILSRKEIHGADLREIRNELGVALETIHQETKIRVDYLNYIEEDQREKLPAAVFLKGFVKAYLKSLCIGQADEICARYMYGLTDKN